MALGVYLIDRIQRGKRHASLVLSRESLSVILDAVYHFEANTAEEAHILTACSMSPSLVDARIEHGETAKVMAEVIRSRIEIDHLVDELGNMTMDEFHDALLA